METNISNKCKAYTSLEQSKKLEEILPVEGADMFIADVFLKEEQTHSYNFHVLTTWRHKNFDELKERENKFVQFIPCWSLAALLNYIKGKFGYFELVYLESTFDGRANKLKNVYRLSIDLHNVYEEEVIDACVKMIVWLKENGKI